MPDALDEMVKNGTLKKGTDDSFNLEWVPTGLPDLDMVLGGGIPRNRISVFMGAESSGKTFLIQLLLKNALASGLTCAYIDLERTYDPRWWGTVGLNLEELLVSQPDGGEAAVDVVAALVAAKTDIVVIDSLAALSTAHEVQESAEKKQVGGQARLINEMLRKAVVLNSKTAVVIINQLRDVIGGYGPATQMPGGRGLRHFNSLTLAVRREGWLKEKQMKVGFNIRVECSKSKVGTPFGECLLPFYFRGEIDMIALLVERAIEAGHISQTGAWYGVLDREKVMGKNTVLDMVRESEDLRHRLEILMGDKNE